MTENQLGSGYTLIEKIGSGAMGAVWRAQDRNGNEVACKILRSEFADDQNVVSKFVAERTALLGVRHPNVVAVHDLVVDAGRLAVVMDLVPGPDMRGALSRVGNVPPAEVARVGSAVAAGLASVHAQGIVHRDVKPENILLDVSANPATPRVSDFGLARIAESGAATRSSLLVGTPNYMAPELADGPVATPAVDIYALGIVLYELASGVTPFEGGTQIAIIRRHADAIAPRPEGIPDPLWGIIDACLAKEPVRRPSAAALVTHLGALVPLLAAAPSAPRLAAPLPVLVAPRPLGSPTAVMSPVSATPVADVPVPPAPAPRKRRGAAIGIVTAVLLGVVALGVGFMALNGLLPGQATGATQSAEDTQSPAPSSSASAVDDGASAAASASAPEASPSETQLMVPDVIGASLSSTRNMFPGVEVTTVYEYDEVLADNTVIAQDPAAGTPMPAAVTLTVSRRPVTIYLAEMETVSSDGLGACETFLDGVAFPNSMCGYYGSSEASWNLSRGFRTVTATVGRSDEAENPDTQVKVEAFLDQRPVWSGTVSLGTPVTMELDVTDALRLRLMATSLDGNYTEVVFGDLKALGLPGEVPEPPE